MAAKRKKRKTDAAGSPRSPAERPNDAQVNRHPTASNSLETYLPLICVFLLLTGCFLCYADSLEHEFVFDDLPNLVENSSLPSFDPVWNLSPEIPRGLQRRAVASWTFTSTYQSFGLSPTFFRLTNLAIHSLAILVLFDLARRILLVSRFNQVDSSLIAFGVAGIWGLHPLQTESVTYIVQRIESLMGLFFILTLYFFFLGTQVTGTQVRDTQVKGTQVRNLRWFWYGLCILSLSLGMLTKEVMIVAPLTVLLFDYVVITRGNWSETGSRWRVYAAFLPITILLLAMTFGTDFGNREKKMTLDIAPTNMEYFLTQPGVICEYLRLSFYPVGLCFDRNWPVANDFWSIAVPGILLIGFLAFAIYLIIRKQSLGWVALSFFLILAPTSSLMAIGTIYFEHRMYLPLAAIATLVVIGIYWLVRKKLTMESTYALALPLAVVILILGLLTHRRNLDYRDQETLAKATLAVDPASHRTLFNLATIYFEKGEYEAALESYQKAVEIDGRRTNYKTGLANVYSETGRPAQALKILDDIDSDFVIDPGELAHQYALAYDRSDQWEQAEMKFKEAIELNPYDLRIQIDYAAGMVERNNISGGVEILDQVLKIEPQNFEANLNMGTIIMISGGSVDQAIRHFETAVRAKPNSEVARGYLNRALAVKTGNPNR